VLTLMTVASGEPRTVIERRSGAQGYATFQEDVGESVVSLLTPVQERYRELRADGWELRRLLALGAEKARAISAPTLASMYERMGFVRL